jgi:membrane associated rhomboid family serine protease
MIIPYKTNVYYTRIPFVNITLIGIMVALYIAMINHESPFFELMVLSKDNIFTGLLSVYFIHGSFFHLLGNTIILWTFGNAVNSRLGNIQYLILFFAIGIISSLFHIVLDGNPAVGASGAVSGIIGFFLVLFPKKKVKCLVFFGFFIRTAQLSSIFLILFWLFLDLFGLFFLKTNIAYIAHISGMISGFVAGYLMLKLELVEMFSSDRPMFR